MQFPLWRGSVLCRASVYLPRQRPITAHVRLCVQSHTIRRFGLLDSAMRRLVYSSGSIRPDDVTSTRAARTLSRHSSSRGEVLYFGAIFPLILLRTAVRLRIYSGTPGVDMCSHHSQRDLT